MEPIQNPSFPAFAVMYILELDRNKESGLRQGQILYNLLYAVRKDIAELLRGAPNDPFYLDFIPGETWEFIDANWREQKDITS